jgi:hypothetical protein
MVRHYLLLYRTSVLPLIASTILTIRLDCPVRGDIKLFDFGLATEFDKEKHGSYKLTGDTGTSKCLPGILMLFDVDCIRLVSIAIHDEFVVSSIYGPRSGNGAVLFGKG